MMTFRSQLEILGLFCNPKIPGLEDTQSCDFGIENAAGIPGLQSLFQIRLGVVAHYVCFGLKKTTN